MTDSCWCGKVLEPSLAALNQAYDSTSNVSRAVHNEQYHAAVMDLPKECPTHGVNYRAEKPDKCWCGEELEEAELVRLYSINRVFWKIVMACPKHDIEYKANEPQSQPLHELKQLLAIIHRDGGQHTERVGFQQSVEDAHHVWGKLMTKAEQPQPRDLVAEGILKPSDYREELSKRMTTAWSAIKGAQASNPRASLAWDIFEAFAEGLVLAPPCPQPRVVGVMGCQECGYKKWSNKSWHYGYECDPWWSKESFNLEYPLPDRPPEHCPINKAGVLIKLSKAEGGE